MPLAGQPFFCLACEIPMSSSPPLKIVILGPYKSGTTGLYHKIANSLPGPFRGVFEQRHFTPSATEATGWVLAKTIIWYQPGAGAADYRDFMAFDRKIFLIRDPRDWLVSACLFIIQQEPSLYSDDAHMALILNALRAKERDPAGQSLTSLLALVLGLSTQHDFATEMAWMQRHFQWLPRFEKEIGDHLVVRYEDFVDGRLGALEAYLGLPLGGSAEVAVEHDHVPRTRGYGNWRHWCTPEDVALLRPYFRDYMAHYQYADDWDLAKPATILPAHCTAYVLRTVNKRRQSPLVWP